jgi:hypothetical protein
MAVEMASAVNESTSIVTLFEIGICVPVRVFFLSVFLAFSFFGCISSGPVSLIKLESKGPQHPIVAGCLILDPSGNLLWSYPSELCVFLPDGRFISGGRTGIELHSPDLKVVWHRDIIVHHMLSLAANGDILALTTEGKIVGDYRPGFETVLEVNRDQQELRQTPTVPKHLLREKFGVDKPIRLDMNGNLLFEHSFFSDEQYPLKVLAFIHEKNLLELFPLEATHMNSIYEIPPNDSPLQAFRAGNILANDCRQRMIFILDAHLENILWRIPYEALGYGVVHDVRVLPNGHLLLFKNFTYPGGDSSLEEVDPIRRLSAWRYFDPVPGAFRVQKQGSVQLLHNNQILFSFSNGKTSRAKLINRDGEIIWQVDLSQHTGINTQGAYELPVESFLHHSVRL